MHALQEVQLSLSPFIAEDTSLREGKEVAPGPAL